MVRICAGSGSVSVLRVPATAGAMICFATPVEPQIGHSTSPRAAWSS
jgi:hypothetical protein